MNCCTDHNHTEHQRHADLKCIPLFDCLPQKCPEIHCKDHHGDRTGFITVAALWGAALVQPGAIKYIAAS